MDSSDENAAAPANVKRCCRDSFMEPNVIEAAAAFRCQHLYAALTPRSLFMFICIRCGHRAECLQLSRRHAPTRVLAFTRPEGSQRATHCRTGATPTSGRRGRHAVPPQFGFQ
jgi:hypothetical protein